MTCGHDKSFKERCIECELVLVREGLAWSERKAAEYREAAVRLEAELAAYPLTRPQRHSPEQDRASARLQNQSGINQSLSEGTPREGVSSSSQDRGST